ncbi:hypothetical protein [Chryseobacterium sp.]|uniref:hypothetical protein n=1 Tax=Chryseobacterium sp. TaxID=1871047 RepID=UPI0026385A0C|nr:hypothetical protein [Chryseobacterium sp.]
MATITFRMLSKSHTDLLKSVKNYNDKSEWATTQNRFVAFFDILGFKELVLRSSHDDIFKRLSDISDLRKEINPQITDKEFSNDKNKPIEIITFSDSIIIFSKNDSEETFKVFIESINWIFARIIEVGLPVKGAFAHGEVSVDVEKQIYFGQAFIDAFQLQEDVDYFGAVAHNSIDKFISDNKIEGINELLFEIVTPLKSGKIRHLNLKYFPFIVYSEDEKMYEYLEKFKLSASGKARKYLENTFNFYEGYLKNYK